jgi:hypothetical protein
VAVSDGGVAEKRWLDNVHRRWRHPVVGGDSTPHLHHREKEESMRQRSNRWCSGRRLASHRRGKWRAAPQLNSAGLRQAPGPGPDNRL